MMKKLNCIVLNYLSNDVTGYQEGIGVQKLDCIHAKSNPFDVPNLDRLNVDVFNVILKFLSTEDKVSLGRVCYRKGLYCIVLYCVTFIQNFSIRLFT